MDSRKEEISSLEQQEIEKYSYAEEQDALSWLQDIVGEGSIFNEGNGMKMIGNTLRDGVYLCKLMQKLQPDLSIEINTPEVENEAISKENIETFLRLCRECGIGQEDLFKACDLYDGINLYLVVKTIISIKAKFLPTSVNKSERHQSTLLPAADKRFRFSNLISE